MVTKRKTALKKKVTEKAYMMESKIILAKEKGYIMKLKRRFTQISNKDYNMLSMNELEEMKDIREELDRLNEKDTMLRVYALAQK